MLFILARDFQDNDRSNDVEHQARLSRFNGASAISSDAYFSRGDNSGSSSSGPPQPGADMDLTAAELVNRLSFHVGGRHGTHMSGGWFIDRRQSHP